MLRKNWNDFLIYLLKWSYFQISAANSLSYEEKTEKYAVKNINKKGILEMYQAASQ